MAKGNGKEVCALTVEEALTNKAPPSRQQNLIERAWGDPRTATGLHEAARAVAYISQGKTMVVEMGEATINGETTDGWLRALYVETIP